MKRIIIEISNEQLLSNCNEIVVKVRKESKTQDTQQVFFSRYMQEQIENWEEKKHYRTAATYLSTKNSFMAFRNNQDIPFSQIDKRVIENYERWGSNGSADPEAHRRCRRRVLPHPPRG